MKAAKKAADIEPIQTAAEIELAGLEARRNAIKQIVDKARQRKDLLQKDAAEKKKANSIESQIRMSETNLSRLEWSLNNTRPFAVENNEVTIRRVKWWQPVKKEAEKGK
jgi:hypothetical protein